MMKHTGSLTLGLGLIFGLPAFTLGGGLPDSVSSALDDTLRALDVLKGLEQELAAGISAPTGTIERITDAPIGTPLEREERLVDLREEVAVLQSQVDTKRLRAGSLDTELAPLTITNTGGYVPSATDTTGQVDSEHRMDTRGVTTGLSETFVKALGSGEYGPSFTLPQGVFTGSGTQGGGQSGTGPQSGTDTSQPGSATKQVPTAEPGAPVRSPEGKGYSANHLRQAKACFRAARYQQGVDILTAMEPSAQVDYLHARCLEKLGMVDEAVVLYQAVEVADDAGDLAAAAKRDREFAEWRREFERKSGITTSDKESSQ